jgi:ammonia channel protein AmtB
VINLTNGTNSTWNDYAGGSVVYMNWPVIGIVAALVIGIVAYKILWK